jgi:hypothetical protein
MTAYDAGAWSIFALATAASSAALTGSLVLAVAVNFDRVQRHPRLPGRAAMTFGVLTTVLVTSLFVLAPGQSQVALGVEVAVLGLGLAIATVTWLARAPQSPEGPPSGLAVPALVASAPARALVVGGLSIEAGTGGGLYWVLAACLLGVVGAVYGAWALLVDVNR